MTKLGQQIERLEGESASLLTAVEAFAMRRYQPGAGNGYEDERYLVTKVQGTTRTWDPDKLLKSIGRGLWKQCVQINVVPAKVDELVRSGKVTLDQVEVAFDEKPKAPYVKVTPRSESQDGADEAAGLRAALEAHGVS